MKKQILTLTMCLALTSTVALAGGTEAVTTKTTAPIAKAQIKSITNPSTNTIKQSEIKNPQMEEARKRFEGRKAQERGLMYETLGLSAEQKAKAEALDAKTRSEAGKYLRKVQIEARRLRDLKVKHASFLAIYKQKHALKVAKNNAQNYFKSSRKSFEAILTKEQLAKFKILDEAKRKEMEQYRKGQKPNGGPNYIGPKPPTEGFGSKGPHGPEPIGPTPEDKK